MCVFAHHMFDFAHSYVCVHTCEMVSRSHSYVWCCAFTCIHSWYVAHSYVCVCSSMKWCIYRCQMCDTLHALYSYGWHGAFTCVILVIHMCDVTPLTLSHSACIVCLRTVWHSAFIVCLRSTWRIHTCESAHSCVCVYMCDVPFPRAHSYVSHTTHIHCIYMYYITHSRIHRAFICMPLYTHSLRVHMCDRSQAFVAHLCVWRLTRMHCACIQMSDVTHACMHLHEWHDVTRACISMRDAFAW